MDVTTTLKVQKLGRMMLRLDEAPVAAFAFSDQVDGWPWSQTFSQVAKSYSSDEHVGGSASSYSCRPQGLRLERGGSISPMGPRRADASSATSIQAPAAIVDQATFMPEAFSWSSERGRPRRVLSWSHGVDSAEHHPRATGLSYHLDESAESTPAPRQGVRTGSRDAETNFLPLVRWAPPSRNSAAMRAPRVGLPVSLDAYCRLADASRATGEGRQLSGDCWGFAPRTGLAPRCCWARSSVWAGP